LSSDVDAETQDELRIWSRALHSYRAQKWDDADVDLGNLRRLAPENGLYELYAERIAAFRRVPPPAGWDGVTTFDEK
jgi:adenylate cyclase